VSIEIVQSSPEALKLADTATDEFIRSTTYPFDKLEKGQSFTLKLSEAKLGSIQSLCSRKSRGGKVFKMIKHEALDVLEVARLA
jgi:hypothetical protein